MDLKTFSLNPTIVDQLIQDRLVREGHFQYKSGMHSAAVLDRDRLLTDPRSASRMGYALAKCFFTDKIDTVATPSVWGAGLAQWVAYFLEPRAKVVYATPQPNGDRRVAKNLVDLIAGKRVLLIDNLILSGETMLSFDAHIREVGGNVLGIGALWIGGDLHLEDEEIVGLLNHRYPASMPEECPLCRRGDASIEILPY